MTLDIQAMTERVFAVAGQATDAEWSDGMFWYASAHSEACELADTFGVSLECAAGVIAALSPRLPWSVNVSYARSIFATGNAPAMFGNKAKALRIANGENPLNVLGGDKVRSFYANILTPGFGPAVTIDRHAVDVALGFVGDDKSRKVLDRRGGYDAFAEAYQNAAALLGISAAQCQAIAWVTHRNNKREAVAA